MVLSNFKNSRPSSLSFSPGSDNLFCQNYLQIAIETSQSEEHRFEVALLPVSLEAFARQKAGRMETKWTRSNPILLGSFRASLTILRMFSSLEKVLLCQFDNYSVKKAHFLVRF